MSGRRRGIVQPSLCAFECVGGRAVRYLEALGLRDIVRHPELLLGTFGGAGSLVLAIISRRQSKEMAVTAGVLGVVALLGGASAFVAAPGEVSCRIIRDGEVVAEESSSSGTVTCSFGLR